MELQTQRLIIIPCTNESLSTFATEEYKIGSHINNYLEKLKEDSSLLGWGVWLVINKENNAIIGDIGFKGKPDSENIVEVGYGIVPAAQNKGYATEAVNEILKWAFSSGNVKTIVAECLIDNITSIKVLEKLNMKRIGIKNNMYLWQLSK
ncbi:GNAT family N-acetyltransferase [Paenibacillus sp. BSR1-1]|uniref:GNAT family N-acetyltransferase n=1 Tax=Paenibacillus sp. BSR1-1 TaxID=3020845 RepID=UPI0025B07634|nr:GNAT family N-acetyltransferase [Paenibacillus sp. BSR1-1]MDN3015671.1 GNAT family N-acetyltransferase [Paenibacillus sp. BSR1-1]